MAPLLLVALAACAHTVSVVPTATPRQINDLKGWMDMAFPFAASCAPAEPRAPALLTLLPEGGQLVAGLRSRVHLQAPAGSVLTLVDDRGQIAVRGEVGASGVGSFSFRPWRDRSYRLVASIPGRGTVEQALQAIPEEGCVMETTPVFERGMTVVEVHCTEPQRVHLVARHPHLGSVDRATVDVGEDGAIAHLSAPAGPSTVHLFNAHAVTLGERQVFIDPDNPAGTIAQDGRHALVDQPWVQWRQMAPRIEGPPGGACRMPSYPRTTCTTPLPVQRPPHEIRVSAAAFGTQSAG